MQQLADRLTSLPFFSQQTLDTLGTDAVHFGTNVLSALAILVLMWFVSSWLARGATSVLRRTKAEGTLISFVDRLIRWTVRVIALVLCLSVFGVETTSIAALLGGAGVAIGIALQGNLANLASGVVLLAFRPFKDGDWVTVAGLEGKVAGVGLLHTLLDAFDNARHSIPNAQVVEQALTNHEFHDWRRADLEVGVAYDTDLEQALEVLRDVAKRMSLEGAPRNPLVIGLGFGASSIDFKIGVWCRTPDLFGHRTQLMIAIKKAFDEAGIQIPFPQRDLHLIPPVPELAVASAS